MAGYRLQWKAPPGPIASPKKVKRHDDRKMGGGSGGANRRKK